MIGWDDCPHLQPPYVSQQELDDIERDMLPHQRQARRTGRPSLGAGAIYPVNEDQLIIEPFKIPDHYERGWAMDVGWKKTAALVGARDPDTGTYYLTHEYYVGESQPIVHAHGIKTMLPWADLEGAIDPAAGGSSQRDGRRLRDEYENLGLTLTTANNAKEGDHAGLHHVLVLMQGNQLKIFSTLLNTIKELRLYRRDEKGKIIKENDHLMDCMRYLLFTDDIFTTQPVQRAAGNYSGEW